MKIVNQLPLSLLLPSAVSSLLKRLKDIAEKTIYVEIAQLKKEVEVGRLSFYLLYLLKKS